MIFWQDSKVNSEDVLNFINEANDDELEKVIIEANKRKNQSRFKNNLILAFDGRCAISQTSVNNVLEGCHIIPHSESGKNSTTNGILLRSDIHKLFDLGLILIHPKYLRIAVDDSLKQSEYYELHNQKIKVSLGERWIKNLAKKWEKHSCERNDE
ncbi:HNH endonuclease [Allomuricauda sp. M10]|uniref:HNH endonuclease n=1 Tax=Allomuricauda sp. M10 TaxID=2683292 RepID=UPI001D195D45|nr:HNH endonuclease signature motif containing protein [Muricauda sp. M10]